jgi:hypothetical protein
MTTPWTDPTIIVQFAETDAENIHLLWDNTNNYANIKNDNEQGVGTMQALYHIARSPETDINSKTYYIRATGYNFYNLPSTVSGVELRLKTKRGGRVTDDTVQLCLNGEDIGENRADLVVNPLKYYGGENDFWGLGNITVSTVQNNTFGVTLRFKSHPQYPHRDAVFVDCVQIRIH